MELKIKHTSGSYNNELHVIDNEIVHIEHDNQCYNIGAVDLMKIIHSGYVSDKERLNELYGE